MSPPRLKVILFSSLCLSLLPILCDTSNPVNDQKLWYHNHHPNHLNKSTVSKDPNLSDREAKGLFAQQERSSRKKIKRNRTKPTQSSVVSKSDHLNEEYENYDEVENKLYFIENGELYDQLAQDTSKRRTNPFRRPLFVKSRPKSEPHVQHYNQPESGYYDSEYQTGQKTPPTWLKFLRTLVTCLPISVAAAAIPLGFIDFTGTTSTVTMNLPPVTITVTTTITEQPTDIRLRNTRKPKKSQAIHVKPKPRLQKDNISFGNSSKPGKSSWLHLSPTKVRGNETTSDLPLFSGWTKV